MPATNQSVSDARTRPQVIVVTGVAGAGKTTVGRALAAHLHYESHEGDDYHPTDGVDYRRRQPSEQIVREITGRLAEC